MTEKLDGTSFTAFIRQGEFGICSRNLWMDEADESNVLVRVAKGLDWRRCCGPPASGSGSISPFRPR